MSVHAIDFLRVGDYITVSDRFKYLNKVGT